MTYKNSRQEEVENSPRFIVNHYRNMEQEESALDSFLFWLKYESDYENFPEMEKFVNEYLGRDISKIKKSEQALLDAWTLAAKS